MVTRLSYWLEKVEEGLCVLLITVMFVVMALQVFSRYVLDRPLTWSEELARVLFIWITFIGASVALGRGSHVAFDLLLQRLPDRLQVLLHGVTAIVIAALWAAAVPAGISFVRFMNTVPSAALQWPLGVFYLAVPVGGLFMGVHALALGCEAVRGLRRLPAFQQDRGVHPPQ